MLVFVIPLQHPATTSDWPRVLSLLSRTTRSACAQREGPWRAVVVSNRGVPLPGVPPAVEVAEVDFEPPDPVPRRENFADEEEWRRALRFDKGRRVLMGVLHARATGEADYVMTVDADDFVSDRLAGHVAGHAAGRTTHPSGANGFYLPRGYVWDDGGGWLYLHPEFHLYCGTSHIVRTDLLDLPDRVETADPEYIRWVHGSHKVIAERLQEQGTPLAPLPFPGAIYRIGHADSASNSRGLQRTFYPRWQLRSDPVEFCRRLGRLRRVSPAIRAEFGIDTTRGDAP